MLKRLKYLVMLNLLPGAVYLFLRLLGRSMSIRQVNREAIDRLWREGEASSSAFGMADCSPCLLLLPEGPQKCSSPATRTASSLPGW